MVQCPTSTAFYLHFFNFPSKYAPGNYDQVCSFRGFQFGEKIYSNLENVKIEKYDKAWEDMNSDDDLDWRTVQSHYDYEIVYREHTCGTLSISFFSGHFWAIGKKQVNKVPCAMMGVSTQYKDSYIATNYVIDTLYWDYADGEYGHYKAKVNDKSYEEIDPNIRNENYYNVICYLNGGESPCPMEDEESDEESEDENL